MVVRLTEREGAWKRAKMRNRERAKARTRQCFDLADFLLTDRMSEWKRFADKPGTGERIVQTSEKSQMKGKLTAVSQQKEAALSWCYRCRPPPFLLALFFSLAEGCLAWTPSVNVRTSCCSSQTTQWENHQPHRPGNPLSLIRKKKARRRRRKGLLCCWPPSFPCAHTQTCPSTLPERPFWDLKHVGELPGFLKGLDRKESNEGKKKKKKNFARENVVDLYRLC